MTRGTTLTSISREGLVFVITAISPLKTPLQSLTQPPAVGRYVLGTLRIDLGSTETGNILDGKTLGRPRQISRTVSREAASKKILPGEEANPKTQGTRN